MDAAKQDDVGLRRLRLVGKAQRIAHVIGDLLDLLHLVIVREDDGVFRLLQRHHFFLQLGHPLNLAHCRGGVYS